VTAVDVEIAVPGKPISLASVPVLDPTGTVSLDSEPVELTPDCGEYKLSGGLWVPESQETVAKNPWDWKSIYASVSIPGWQNWDDLNAGYECNPLPGKQGVTATLSGWEKVQTGLAPFLAGLLGAEERGRTPSAELADLIPALHSAMVHCPVGCWEENSGGQSVSYTIQHLNDDHTWPREDIADWLETLDIDLTFQPASKGN
jgi:hypothetical protein